MQGTLVVRTFAVVLSASSLVGANSSTSTLARRRPVQTRPVHPDPNKKPPCALAPDSLFSMFVPLSHARFFGAADVMLNNRGVVDHDVVPTWYVQGRGTVVGSTIHLPASHADFYPLDAFLPQNVSLAAVDGLQLSYLGKNREIWAQVNLRPKQGAQPTQSLDAPFNMRADFKSARLESVSPAVRQTEHAVVAIANTADNPLTVHVTDSDGSSDITLDAHSGKLLNRPSHERAAAADWLRLDSNGKPGDLRATGFVLSSEDNHPRLTRFYDPAVPAQQNLFATGVPVNNVALTIALKNTSAQDVTAIAEFLDNTTGVPLATLPAVQVAAGSATLVQPSLESLSGVERLALRVNNIGPAGSLIGTLHITNRATDIGYEMPLRDSGGARSSTGGYPWRLDGDYQTTISITNVGSTAARYTARLHFGSTDYVFAITQLPVGASAVFDIRKLRDSGAPDVFGNTIPTGLDHGQFHWSILDPTPGAHLAGRAEVVSKNEHVSSSFSCQQCCPDSTVDGWAYPDDFQLSTNVTEPIGYYVWVADCTNAGYAAPAFPGSFANNDQIVSVEWGDHISLTGQGEGSDTVHGYWDGEVWSDVMPENADEEDHCESQGINFDAPAGVEVQDAYPKNFRRTSIQGGVAVAGPGVNDTYEWVSSFGGTNNLAPCVMWESVIYTPQDWPNPPFFQGDSPVSKPMGDAKDLAFTDHHFGPYWLTGLTTGHFDGSQVYYYRCNNGELKSIPAADNGTNWSINHNIARDVAQIGGIWRYLISKDGTSGQCNLRPNGSCQ